MATTQCPESSPDRFYVLEWFPSQRYANEPLAAQLQAYRGKVKHDYDWCLNAP
jgi:hypothetical protein